MSIYYLLYSVITGVGVALLSPYFIVRDWFRGPRSKRYLQTLPERMGWRFPAALSIQRATDGAGGGAAAGGETGTVWLHAVSVGEALAAVPLARQLKERFPDRRLVISTTTATGQALARERMAFADAIFYFPLDWRRPVRRALRAVQPELVIVMETEIWPNFLREMRRAGVPVLFVNGRISERSFASFERAIRMSGGMLRGFLRDVLRAGTFYLVQGVGDCERLIALGAPAERVIVAGNMKYDQPAPAPNAPPNLLAAWLAAEATRSRRRPLLVAGSVMEGEETAVLEALRALEATTAGATPLLVLAPRKPDRFGAAAALVERGGRGVVRRSELKLAAAGGAFDDPHSVLLLDTIGELAALYRLADAVFIGGSLEPFGGHNPLEAAAAGKPPVFGPSMQNFRDIAKGLLAADAAIEVHSSAELASAWCRLIADPECSARMGRAAQELVEQNRGATGVALDWALKLLEKTPAPVQARA